MQLSSQLQSSVVYILYIRYTKYLLRMHVHISDHSNCACIQMYCLPLVHHFFQPFSMS